jgi:hypothetical protein
MRTTGYGTVTTNSLTIEKRCVRTLSNRATATTRLTSANLSNRLNVLACKRAGCTAS